MRLFGRPSLELVASLRAAACVVEFEGPWGINPRDVMLYTYRTPRLPIDATVVYAGPDPFVVQAGEGQGDIDDGLRRPIDAAAERIEPGELAVAADDQRHDDDPESFRPIDTVLGRWDPAGIHF